MQLVKKTNERKDNQPSRLQHGIELTKILVILERKQHENKRKRQYIK